MRRSHPQDAMRLLASDSVVSFACDIVRNPAFRRASATTRDARGRRVADYISGDYGQIDWKGRVQEILCLETTEFELAMSQEPVRLVSIPKGRHSTRDIVIPTFVRRCVSNAFHQTVWSHVRFPVSAVLVSATHPASQ